MKKMIPCFYMEYGRYINRFRSMPYMIDALKPVERRVLLSLYNTAKDHKVKCAKVVGDCLGNYHPHGDCISGDAEVLLYNRETKTLRELTEIGEKQEVFSFNLETKEHVKGIAHNFRLAQRTNEFLKITLLNHEFIECTYNHPLLTRDEEKNYQWKKAEDLKIGDTLVIYRKNIHKYNLDNFRRYMKIFRLDPIILDEPKDFYDFTVDGYNNMLVYLDNSTSPNKDCNYKTNVIAHNSSIYGCLTDTIASNDFIIRQGNFGSYGLKEDNPPAAMRYTECQLKPEIRDLAFKYIKYVDFENVEFGDEPLFLPSPIPLGLIGYDLNFGISFSHIKIPRYTIKDLAKRLYWLLENELKYDIDDESVEINEDNFGPIIKPNFRNCQVKDRTKGRDFLRLLIKGIATLVAIPNGNINKNSIEILGRVPGKSFDTLLKATVKRKLESGKEIPVKLPVNLLDNCGNKDNPYNINILIEPKVSIANIQEFAKKIWNDYLVTNINFNCLFYDDDGKLYNLGIDDVLKNNYNYWLSTKLKKRAIDLEYLLKLRFDNIGLQLIRDILQNNPQIKSTQEIINIYLDWVNNENNKEYYSIEYNIYNYEENEFEIEKREYLEEDIKNIIKNKSIKQLIENEIDLKSIDNQISIAINKINNIEIDGKNIIKELIN